MTVCLATRSLKLTNMADAVGYSVLCFVAFNAQTFKAQTFKAQTFVFASKTKGNVVSSGVWGGGALCKMFVFYLLCHYMAAR